MSLLSALPVLDRPSFRVALRRPSETLDPTEPLDPVAPLERVVADADPVASAQAADGLPAYAVDCTILTPSGTVVAHGRVAPRAQEHVAEAYAVQLTEIEPRGVLEAMVYSDQPTIVLRYEGAAESRVRIDHITGPAPSRAFFCQTA